MVNLCENNNHNLSGRVKMKIQHIKNQIIKINSTMGNGKKDGLKIYQSMRWIEMLVYIRLCRLNI